MPGKKKILVVFTREMELGGIERSLLGLLENIDYDHYDVDLFLYAHHGTLYNLIDQRVRLLPEVRELSRLGESIVTKLKHGCFLSVFLRLFSKVKSCSKHFDLNAIYEPLVNFYVHLERHYDIALGFFQPFDVILNKVSANVKVGWIHTDYRCVKLSDRALRQYEKLDYIASVSEECRKCMDEDFPQLKDKSLVIENILSTRYIHTKAKEEPDDIRFSEEKKCIKLLSVGRYVKAKNFDNIPEICSFIRKKGLNIKWYLIGFGEYESLIERKIAEFHMEGYVINLGKKMNPYSYMARCDLYIQPSRFEGKAVTVREAQVLGKPVIITDYATAQSQLRNGIDGMIVPSDNQGCASGIANLLQDPNRMEELQKRCLETDFSGAAEVNKIYGLIADEA